MALIGQAVSEEKIFEIVDGRWTDDGRTPDHGHPISSPCEPNGSGELNQRTIGPENAHLKPDLGVLRMYDGLFFELLSTSHDFWHAPVYWLQAAKRLPNE